MGKYLKRNTQACKISLHLSARFGSTILERAHSGRKAAVGAVANLIDGMIDPLFEPRFAGGGVEIQILESNRGSFLRGGWNDRQQAGGKGNGGSKSGKVHGGFLRFATPEWRFVRSTGHLSRQCAARARKCRALSRSPAKRSSTSRYDCGV